MKTNALNTPIKTEMNFSLADEVLFSDSNSPSPRKVLLATALLLAAEDLRTNTEFELDGIDRNPLARLQGGQLAVHVVIKGAFNDFMPAYFEIFARAAGTAAN